MKKLYLIIVLFITMFVYLFSVDFFRSKRTIIIEKSGIKEEILESQIKPPSKPVFLSPGNGVRLNSSDLTITGTCDGKVDSINVKLNSGEWIKATGTNSWTYTFLLMTEGTHIIYAKAVNQKGESLSSEITIIIDRIAPSISFTGPLSGYITNNAFSIQLSVDDNFGYYSLNNGSYNKFGKTESPLGININTSISIKYYGSDGMNTSATQEVVYTFDTNGPIALIISPSDGSEQSTTFSTTITNYDNLVSVQMLYILTNGGLFSNIQSPSAEENVSITMPYGNHDIKAYAVDNLGNIGSTNSISIDVFAIPIVSISSPTNNFKMNSSNINISGTATISSPYIISQVELSLNAGAYLDVGNTNWYTNNVNLNEGTNTLQVRAIGSSGKTNTTSVINVIIDSITPIVEISTGPTNNIITNQSFNIELTTSENNGYWKTNNSGWQEFNVGPSGNITINANETTYLYYYGNDGLNTSTTNIFTYVVDTMIPTVTITSGPTNDVYTNQSFEIQLTSDETNGFWSTNGMVFNSFYPTTNIIIITNTPCILFYAEDMAHNNSSTNSNNYLWNYTTPNVTIPAGPTNNITTNESFNITLSVDENFGYWSTNSSPFYQLLLGSTNINISETTTLKYYGGDIFGNISSTNTVVFSFAYTVTYNGNGNTSGSVPIDNNNYTNGQTATILSNTGELGKTSNVFIGWTNSSGSEYLGSSTINITNSDVLLYAKWTNYFASIAYREIVSVPGGTFIQAEGRWDNFSHTISNFQIGKYEVTYELWYKVRTWATNNGYTFANDGTEGKDGSAGEIPTGSKYEPVQSISWRDMMIWCNAYSEMSGYNPIYYSNSGKTTILKTSSDSSTINTTAGSYDNPYVKWVANGYRLPTEAEWEYAARYQDGSTWTPYDYASGATNDYSNASACQEVAWYDVNSGINSHIVGTKKTNQLGIYDMSGNASELCWDWLGSYPGASTNYRGPSSGTDRACRGGTWEYDKELLQTGYQGGYKPYYAFHNMGFRVVRQYE